MKTGKNMASRLIVAGVVAVALVVLAGPAGAAPISVANFSFEDPVLADGTAGAPTSWTFVGMAGTGHANPVDAQYAGATGRAVAITSPIKPVYVY